MLIKGKLEKVCQDSLRTATATMRRGIADVLLCLMSLLCSLSASLPSIKGEGQRQARTLTNPGLLKIVTLYHRDSNRSQSLQEQ